MYEGRSHPFTGNSQLGRSPYMSDTTIPVPECINEQTRREGCTAHDLCGGR
jgi:hypothetical protein